MKMTGKFLNKYRRCMKDAITLEMQSIKRELEAHNTQLEYFKQFAISKLSAQDKKALVTKTKAALRRIGYLKRRSARIIPHAKRVAKL